MPRAALSLLQAYDRYPYGRREDRVTEVFATVLRLLPELSAWLVERSGLPRPMGRVQIETQSVRGGAGRPDLVIDFFDSEDHLRRLISEHKLDAAPTIDQLGSYGDWDRDALILIAPSNYRASSAFSEFEHVTWYEVGRELDRLGRLRGRRWREYAMDPASPSALRLLLELLVLLERHNIGVDVPDPVAVVDVLTFGREAETRQKMTTLTDLIRQDRRLEPLQPAASISSERDLLGFGLSHPWPLLREWNSDSGAQVSLWPSDAHPLSWVPEADRLGEPFLSAGFYFATPRDAWPEWLETETVRAALVEAGATLGRHPNGKQGKCQAILYVSDLLTRGRSLADQAAYGAQWAATVIFDLARISDV